MPRDARNKPKMQEIFSLIRHACFVGHTHLPGVFLQDGSFTRPGELWANTYFIEDDVKALINVGSVGQPRDGDKRACYVLLDDAPDSRRVIYRRVEYDLEKTAHLIEQNEFLDNYLADRSSRWSLIAPIIATGIGRRTCKPATAPFQCHSDR